MHLFATSDGGTPQDEQPSSKPWNPEESLAYLESALNGKQEQNPYGDETETETVNEDAEYYVVVYKEEATLQEGKPIFITLMIVHLLRVVHFLQWTYTRRW